MNHKTFIVVLLLFSAATLALYSHTKIESRGFQGLSFSVQGKAVNEDEQNNTIWLPIVVAPLPLPTFTNGTFSSGDPKGWTESHHNFLIVDNVKEINEIEPHSPPGVAWLGGIDGVTTSISQQLQVKGRYIDLSLRYWFWIASDEKNCGRDRSELQIDKEIIRIRHLCEDNDSNQWIFDCIDLSIHEARTIMFTFRALLDAEDISNFFVDDVSISSSPCEPPSDEHLHLPTPTQTRMPTTPTPTDAPTLTPTTPTPTPTPTPTLAPTTPTPTDTPTLTPTTPTPTDTPTLTPTTPIPTDTPTLTPTTPIPTDTPTLCPSTIELESNIQCTLDTTVDTDTYSFDAHLGDIILVRMGFTTEGPDPQISVLEPEGNKLCENHYSNQNNQNIAAELTCPLLKDGTHTIIVDEHQGNDIGGSYNLSLDQLNSTGLPIEFGQTITGTLLATTDVNIHTFTTSAASRVLLRMGFSSDGPDPHIRIFDARGNKLCEDHYSNQPDQNIAADLICELPDIGRYNVVASEYDGNNIGGAYSLSLERLNDARAIDFDQPTSDTLLTSTDANIYSFTVAADSNVKINMSFTTKGPDPHLRVLNSRGVLLCEAHYTNQANQNISAELVCPLLHGDKYVMIITEHHDDEIGGTYNLSLTGTPIGLIVSDDVLAEVFAQHDQDASYWFFTNDSQSDFFVGTAENTTDNRCVRTGTEGLRFVHSINELDFAGLGLAWADSSLGYFDASDYASLKFWVKGLAGGEAFRVGLKDTSVNEIFNVKAAQYADPPNSSNWSRVEIPLSVFQGVDLKFVTHVQIATLYAIHNSGDFCIDDVSFLGQSTISASLQTSN